MRCLHLDIIGYDKKMREKGKVISKQVVPFTFGEARKSNSNTSEKEHQIIGQKSGIYIFIVHSKEEHFSSNTIYQNKHLKKLRRI